MAITVSLKDALRERPSDAYSLSVAGSVTRLYDAQGNVVGGTTRALQDPSYRNLDARLQKHYGGVATYEDHFRQSAGA